MEAKKYLHRTQDPENAHKLNPFYVSFGINLLLEQKRFTICQRITSVLIPKDFLWKVMKDSMRQCFFRSEKSVHD